MSPFYVIGHKNPDTDAICSAIGYAALLAEEARTLSQRDPALAQKLLDYSGMVEKSAEYCHHLSENWRLSSKKTADFTRLDILRVAHEVRQVIFFGNVAIQFSGLSEAFVRGSKYELMRVFQNLFKNSLEAGATRLLVTVTRNDAQIELTIVDNGSSYPRFQGVERNLGIQVETAP